MGYRHVITIAHDALLLLDDKELESPELAKVAEQIGKGVLTVCLTAHRERGRRQAGDHLIAPIGAYGGAIVHIDEPYKAELRTYIFEGNALHAVDEAGPDILRRARVEITVAMMQRMKASQWRRLVGFFGTIGSLERLRTPSAPLLASYVAGRPRVARQLLTALNTLITELRDERDLREVLLWHMRCLRNPKRDGCKSHSEWLRLLRRQLDSEPVPSSRKEA